MKYFGGCDVGSTYTKAVILDENGKMIADTTIRSKINSEQSAIAAMDEVLKKVGLSSSKELAYLIGTGYGRNKVPFADENISEISCHAMGVHVTDPNVKAIIDIGGQDVKGISIDTDGTVKNFAMNDKCAAGTGRFFEAMARSFELSLPEFSKLSLTAKNVIPITAQCTVFAESEVITLVGEGKATDEIAAGIEMAVAKRCFVMAKKAGATDSITLTGGCAKNEGLKRAIERVLKLDASDLSQILQVMRGIQESIADGKGLFHRSVNATTVIKFEHRIEPRPGYAFDVWKKPHDGEQQHYYFTFDPSEAFFLMLALEQSAGVIAFGIPQVIPRAKTYENVRVATPVAANDPF